MTPQELARLHRRCFTAPRPWTAAEFAALLATEQNCLVTRPGAFALGRIIADEAELLTIAVAPEERRKGVGRALLLELEQELSARGAAHLFLEVAADNRAALALYRALGYREAGRRAGYYQRPNGAAADALVLSRGLASVTADFPRRNPASSRQ